MRGEVIGVYLAINLIGHCLFVSYNAVVDSKPTETGRTALQIAESGLVV